VQTAQTAQTAQVVGQFTDFREPIRGRVRDRETVAARKKRFGKGGFVARTAAVLRAQRLWGADPRGTGPQASTLTRSLFLAASARPGSRAAAAGAIYLYQQLFSPGRPPWPALAPLLQTRSSYTCSFSPAASAMAGSRAAAAGAIYLYQQLFSRGVRYGRLSRRCRGCHLPLPAAFLSGRPPWPALAPPPRAPSSFTSCFIFLLLTELFLLLLLLLLLPGAFRWREARALRARGG
jgi:hypothetical protein